MSFVTFILLVGCFKAYEANTYETQFDMEQLIYVYSKSIFVWIFEAIVQKGVFMCTNMGNPPFLDLLSYTGYKFVILCYIVAAEGFFGYAVSYIVFFILGALYALFFYWTFGRFSTTNTLADHMKEVSLNKQTFILAECAIQVAIIWLLSYN